MTWTDVIPVIEAQIEELSRLMLDAEYVPFQPLLQQTMAVRIAQLQEVRILATEEKAQEHEQNTQIPLCMSVVE